MEVGPTGVDVRTSPMATGDLEISVLVMARSMA
jgi:hypothetical protein